MRRIGPQGADGSLPDAPCCNVHGQGENFLRSKGGFQECARSIANDSMSRWDQLRVFAMRYIFAAVAGLLAISPTGSSAQSVDVLNLFGGIMGAIQIQGTQEAWSRISEMRRTCLQQLLARQGVRFTSIVQSGVTPDDPRLAALNSQCSGLDPSNLRHDYQCAVQDEAGRSIQSVCDQAFARRLPDGSLQPIPPDEALRAQLSGVSPPLVDVETEDARAQRLSHNEAENRRNQLSAARTQLVTYLQSPAPIVRSAPITARASRTDIVRCRSRARCRSPAMTNRPATVGGTQRGARRQCFLHFCKTVGGDSII